MIETVIINSEKLEKELDDILHYEFKNCDIYKNEVYNFNYELKRFLNPFLNLQLYHDYSISLTDPKIYTADKKRVLCFTCNNFNNDSSYIFYIDNYIGMNEVTVKSKNGKEEEVVWKYQVEPNMTYLPKALSLTKSGVKKSVEILEGKDEYTINYQNGNDKIIKIVLSSEDLSKILSLYDLQIFIAIVKEGRDFGFEYMLLYLIDICQKIKDKFNIKMFEMHYDKERNYFFNYLVIKEGKIQRFEHKVNDLVTILDENSIWHYSDDNVRIDADDNLNETVRFKSGINKRILGRKITRGEQSIKRVRDTLTHIIK